MFDLSWSELLLVGAVALVVIGPRELPRVLRTVGQALARLRRMAGDFQSQFSAAMREAELDEIRNAVGEVKSAADRAIGEGGTFDPVRSVRDELRDAIQKPSTRKPATPAAPPAAATPQAPSPAAPSPAAASPAGAPPPAAAPTLPGRGDAGGEKSGGTKSGGTSSSDGGRKRGRIIVAAPRDAVKPLAPLARGTPRLYRKTRFSALPARQRPAPDGEGEA